MKESSPVANKEFRLFVGNMGSQMTESELRAMIAPFGTIKNIHVVKDELTGNSRGYAFVEMTDQSGAARAISELNGKRVNRHFLISRSIF